MDESDRTILVTGGGGGLGGAVVHAFGRAGWRVVASTQAEADLLDPADLERVVSEIGPLHGVASLVGGFASGPRVADTTAADWDKMLALNLTTAVNVARATIPALLEQGGGPIVLVTSRAAIKPFRGGAPYATSKAALRGFVAALHADYREDGIRVNAVEPDKIDTPANREAMPDAKKKVPPTFVPPAQIAATITWLCSDDATAVAGQVIPVYGAASPP